MSKRWRIGFDIGGTFTDFILYDAQERSVRLHKRLTTPHDPSEAALIGLVELTAMADIGLADVEDIVHGTTLVTNAIIERNGAKLGLITTRGFRDILEMGTEQRYDIYDLFLTFPEPLVSRDLRLEVAERIDHDGRIVTTLDADEVKTAARELAAAGCEAIAVCFLNSYRDAAHEQAAGRIIRETCPDLDVSLSSEVVAEISEYPRFVTTVANAYVQPPMRRYLQRLERELAVRGFHGSLRLMHSAGGLISLETARAFPIRLLESGPAGGGLATALFGELAGHKDVISFDMGGTTAKACLIEDGRAEIAPMLEAGRVNRFAKGSGLPIKAPVIDMIEIGAGGGSIAAIDEVGLLKVGPHSAGSDPGPACYGMGGVKPTVTDANLVLGYYDPEFFLGGRMALDLEAARKAVATVAAPLGLSIEEAAWGIHKVVVESMGAAARVHLVEKGKDPGATRWSDSAAPARRMRLMSLECSALSRSSFRRPRALLRPSDSSPRRCPSIWCALCLSNSQMASMPRQSMRFSRASKARDVGGLPKQGLQPGDVTVERSADMRLVGQMHDIAVPLPADALDESSLETIRAAFTTAYSARYTSLYEGARLEAINFRVRCAGPIPSLSLSGAAGGADADAKVKGVRRAWFEGGWREANVYDRYALRSGDKIEGPAIIEEREATTIIPHGSRVAVDEVLNLVIEVSEAAAAEAMIAEGIPVEEAARRIEADPISLEIMWSRLVNVVEEMWLTVCRTAFSLVISEAQDFACELLDPEGETLAHSPRAMPVFNLTLPRAVKALLARYPAETLKPGDVLITNDPWLCAGHLFDIALVTPVFMGESVVGLMGTVGHVSDIGGTKDSLRAREIYEEGFQIPPMKLYEAGRINETLVRLLAENVRNSQQVLGDLHAFVAANAIGAERLQSFMRDYGMNDLRALAFVVQNRSEKAMREAIAALPNGTYHGTVSNNPLGAQMTYPLALTVNDQSIHIDFTGAPPQLPQGGLNCTLNYTMAHATYPLKCMLTPRVRGNAGCYRAFTIEAPKGSVLNCDKPLAVNLRTRTGWYIAPNIFRALSQAAPAQVQAFTGLPVAASVYGRDSAGNAYSDMLFVGGGQGGSSHGDGKSGLLYPTSAANTSIEMFEARVPMLVIEKTYLADSGGAGKHRGGLGQRVRLRKLADDGLPTLVSLYPEGVNNPIPGLFGGKPGGGASGRVVDQQGHVLKDVGTGELVQVRQPSEVVELVLAGGAGYGPASERARDAIAEDVALGLVSPEAAIRDYGVEPTHRPRSAGETKAGILVD